MSLDRNFLTLIGNQKRCQRSLVVSCPTVSLTCIVFKFLENRVMAF